MPRHNENPHLSRRRNYGAVMTIKAASQDVAATTVAEALDMHLAALRDGSVLSASGRPYKSTAVAKYRRIAERTLKPELGHYPLADVRPSDVWRLVDRLQSERAGTGTTFATLDLLRAIYRTAIERQQVPTDPTVGAASRLAKGPTMAEESPPSR